MLSGRDRCTRRIATMDKEIMAMWIVSTPRAYLVVMLVGIFAGFFLGICATRNHAPAIVEHHSCV